MKKILLIENNAQVRSNTAELLHLSNYSVIEAENGKVGVEKALSSNPDLIICDIAMPELDGYGVLHAIHKNDQIRNTPFIFLTGRNERSNMRKAMELGADDYLSHPFTSTELLNAVDSRIKKMELLRETWNDLQIKSEDANSSFHQHDILSKFIQDRNINKFRKKQVVYAEGNHPNRLYYVKKGKVKVYKRNEDGKELVTQLLGPGDFFGYISLIEGTTYKDTAEALHETELIIIPKEDFDEQFKRSKEMMRYFVHLMTKQLVSREELLLGIAYNSLRRKVAEALLYVKNKFPELRNGIPMIHISRENLAAIAGTATESLIRTLSDFRSEKIIDITDGEILILDGKRLELLHQ